MVNKFERYLSPQQVVAGVHRGTAANLPVFGSTLAQFVNVATYTFRDIDVIVDETNAFDAIEQNLTQEIQVARDLHESKVKSLEDQLQEVRETRAMVKHTIDGLMLE